MSKGAWAGMAEEISANDLPGVYTGTRFFYKIIVSVKRWDKDLC